MGGLDPQPKVVSMPPDVTHPDYAELQPVRAEIEKRLEGDEGIRATFPAVVSSAVDYVIDSVRTGRTRIHELDNVEKTIIGLKVEHFVRDWLGVPPGIRDLDIGGHDVDVKNTVNDNWMIPPETYNEVRGEGIEPGGTCLLIRINEASNRCWLGLVRVRMSYLNAPNRDGKRSISSASMQNIMWLVEGEPYQAGHWQQFDMKRFRELRDLRGGSKRAAAFFSENLGKPVHRSVVLALLHDQLDPMKRLRWNSGAKQILWASNIALLSGKYFGVQAGHLGIAGLKRDQFVAVQLDDAQRAYLEASGYTAADEGPSEEAGPSA